MMHIIFCTDNNYAMPCGVALVSLFENNKGEDITIHILGTGLSDHNKGLLLQTIDKYGAQSLFYDIQEKELEEFELPKDGPQYLSIACCTRLLLADILPESIEKVIYLDSDLLVLGKLNELWNTDMDNYSIAGVIEYLTFGKDVFEKLRYPDIYAYINSGVLLINLKYWRENKIVPIFSAYAESNKDNIKYIDQDILNGTLYESTLLLPIKYNVHTFFYKEKVDAHQFQEDMLEALRCPVVVHFTTPVKPWEKGLLHPFSETWMRYKEMSLWNNYFISWSNKVSFKKKLRYYKRIILISFGLKSRKHVKC